MATCLKTQVIYAFATSGTSTKTAYTVYIIDNATPHATCAQLMVSGAEKTTYDTLSATMGWDEPAFELAFGGALLMFAIGLGIGLIVSAVRRARTI